MAIQALFGFFLIAVSVASSQVHIANDDYFLEKAREKRDAALSCGTNGMTTDTRNVFNKTIASGKTWDCTLEQKAQAVVKECLVDNGGATDGTLKLSIPVTDNSTPETVIAQFQSALGFASTNLNSKSTLKESIGCSYAKCNQRVDVLCLYSRTTSSTLPPLP